MAEKDEIQKRIKEEIARLDKASAKAYQEKLKGLDAINTSLDTYQSLLNNIKNDVANIDKGFSGILKEIIEIVGELEKGNKSTKDATKAFKGLESIASKLKYDQQGYNDLNLDQLKTEKRKLGVLENQARAAAKKIAKDKGIRDLANANLSILTNITEEERAILAAAKEGFDVYERTNQLLEERIKEEKKLERRLGATGAILSGMSKIPIVGPLLKTNEALDDAREKAKAGGNAFQAMGAAAKSIGSNLLTSLSDPLVSIGLLVKAFQMLLELGFKLDKQVVGLQKAFYSSRVEAELLQERFQENVDTNNVLVKGLNSALLSRENQTEAAIQLSNAMGAVGRLTDQEIQSQIKLTKQMGLSVEEGQALYVLGKQNKMTSSEVVDEITKQVKANQKQTGVLLDTKKITQDVSKINGQLRLQYGNNVKQLTAAVIQSNKLGFSLEKSKQIAEQLLNFEESIENELSAELLIGRDLNLEQARLLALNGKSAEATALIAEQMGGSAGFAAMNVIQQESLAKALGMSANELADSLLHQENLSKLKNSDKKLLENEIARLKERGELEKAQQLERAAANGANIQSAIEAISKQDEFNENVKKIKEIIEGIVSGPAFMLAGWITDMIKNSETLRAALTGVAIVIGGALLVSLTKAIISMGVLVGETIAYVMTWAIANPIAAAAGAITAIGIGALIASEISSAREKEKEKAANAAATSAAKTNFATGGVVMSRIDNATIGERGPEAIIPLSSPYARQMMNGGGPIQVTVYGQIDKQTLFTFMAEGERTNSNNLGSARQEANRLPQ
jgi:hypothetical protein